MEDVTGEEGKEETAQNKSVKYPGLAYGLGMRICTKPLSYEPVMTGKTYMQGVNNLCYRGVRYTLDEVLPSGEENMQHKMGVINLNQMKAGRKMIPLQNICWG